MRVMVMVKATGESEVVANVVIESGIKIRQAIVQSCITLVLATFTREATTSYDRCNC